MSCVRVFAYGSNLCIERIRARTPSATVVAAGRLRGHALRWHKRARDGSGKCDIEVTESGRDVVWGAVYELSITEKAVLDGYEGLGEEYFEKTVRIVTTRGEDLDALAYVANPELLDPAVRPWTWYKGFVVAGAAQHSLPPDYQVELDAIESFPDPDGERHAREWSVLEVALRGRR